MLGESAPAPTDSHGPIRVLWLIKGLGPGGAERLLVLAAAVRDRELFHYEAAYLLPWKAAFVSRLESAGVPVHCLRGGSEWDLRWVRRLRRLLIAGRFDVVHVHSPYVAALARIIVRTVPPAARPRMVSTEHVSWSGYVPATRLLNILTFGLDDVHLSVSHGVRDSMPRWVQDRVEVVVHGIAREPIGAAVMDRDRVRSQLGVAPDEVLVGTVANLREQKGYRYLLPAAASLIRAGSAVRFVAVGQGPLEDEIRAMHADLRLGDRFVLTGFHEDPSKILGACDVFVLASLYEGLPLAMMEALAIGLPIVATNIPGIREAVEDGVEALLVPPARSDLLAEAILALVSDPDRRAAMGAAAAVRADRFDISNAVRRTELIYRRLVEGNPAPTAMARGGGAP